jgi:SAM-dependent methyltransferase
LEIPTGELRGIEICPSLFDEGRKRLKLMTVDLENQRWPLPDRSVDLVTINQVLEHLKNAHFCLAEGERVLRVSGHLAIGIPNLSGLMNRLFLLIGRQPMCILFPGPHVRSFTHKAFLRFLRMNPAFSVVRCLGSSLYPFPPPILERGAEKFPGGSAYSFYLLKKIAHRERSVWLESMASIEATSYKHC